MKNILAVTAVLLLLGAFGMILRSRDHLARDYRIFAFLASDPTPDSIEKEFGRPDEVISANGVLVQRGWPLPIVKRGCEIWIYSSATGRNFYIHINKNEQRVEYVFSSSS